MKILNRPVLISATAMAGLVLLQCGSALAQTSATSNDINLTGVTGCVRINGTPVSAPGTCRNNALPNTPPAGAGNSYAPTFAASPAPAGMPAAVQSSAPPSPALKALADAAAAAFRAEADALQVWKAAAAKVATLTAAAGVSRTTGSATNAAEKSLSDALAQANMLAQQAAMKNASLATANPADRSQIQREADDLAIKSTLAQITLAPLQTQVTQMRANTAPLTAATSQAQTDLASAANAEALARQKLAAATAARQTAVAAMKAAINGAGS